LVHDREIGPTRGGGTLYFSSGRPSWAVETLIVSDLELKNVAGGGNAAGAGVGRSEHRGWFSRCWHSYLRKCILGYNGAVD
jgi:hypothetical protein